MRQKIIQLRGKTTKGKDRVAKHGELWMVTSIVNTVGFSNKKGPWLVLKSFDTDNARTVHLKNDENFQVFDLNLSCDNEQRIYYKNQLISIPLKKEDYDWKSFVIDLFDSIYDSDDVTITKSENMGVIIDFIENNEIADSITLWFDDYYL